MVAVAVLRGAYLRGAYPGCLPPGCPPGGCGLRGGREETRRDARGGGGEMLGDESDGVVARSAAARLAVALLAADAGPSSPSRIPSRNSAKGYPSRRAREAPRSSPGVAAQLLSPWAPPRSDGTGRGNRRRSG